MKKLLFVPLFGALAWLGSCSFHFPAQPNPAEIIQQAHEALPFPSIPAVPQIVVPPPPAPKKKTGRVYHRGVVVKTSPRVAPTPILPPVEEPSVDTSPECLFPFNLVPGCRPQEP